MAEPVSDEDNPMLLKKPKPVDPAIDIYGRNIPIDGSKIPVNFRTKQDDAADIVTKLFGPGDGIKPFVKITTPENKKIESVSDWFKSLGVIVGIKGTF